MSVGKNQVDYQKYFAFLKNNYQKGIHNLATLLSTPTQAEEFVNNLGAVSVIFGVPYSNKDPNSDRLFDILMSSGKSGPGEDDPTFGEIALDIWLQDKYGVSMADLTEATTFRDPNTITDQTVKNNVIKIQGIREQISTDAVAFRAVASTKDLKYFIEDAMDYEAAAKVIAGAYLPLYQLLSDIANTGAYTSFDTAYRRQRAALITANSEVLYKSLLKFCDLSNDDNNIINDTSIDSLESLLLNQSVMNQVCNSWTTLMAMVSMISARATYSDACQDILNNAIHNASNSVITGVVTYVNNNPNEGKIPMQFICENDYLWEAFFHASYGVGAGLSNLFGIGGISQYNTIDEIVQSASAMQAIVASGDCIVNMLRSDKALSAIASSSTAMSLLISSEPAMQAIAQSENAMNILSNMPSVMDLIVNQPPASGKDYPIAMHAFANSEIAMKVLANNEMAINKIYSSNTALPEVMKSAIAYKAINRSEVALSVLFSHSNTTIVTSYLNSLNIRKDLINDAIEGMEYIASVGSYTAKLLNHAECLGLIVESQNAMNALAGNSVSRTAIQTNANALAEIMDANVMSIAKIIAGFAGLDPKKYNTCKELFSLETDIKEVLNNITSRTLTFNYPKPAKEIVDAECTSYDVNGSGSVIHAMRVVCAHTAGMEELARALVGMTAVAKSNQAILDIISYIDGVGVRTALNIIMASDNAMQCLYNNTKEVNYSTNTSATMYMAGNDIAMEYIAKSVTALTCLVRTASRSDAAETEMVANNGVAAPAICTNVAVAKPTIILEDIDCSMLKKMINNPSWFTLMVANGWIADMAKTDGSGLTSSQWTIIAADSATMTVLAANSSSMTSIAASSTAMTAIAASSTAMTKVAASSTAMTAIAASTTAMNIIANSGTAMNSINGSSTAINIVKASRIAMYYIGKYNSVTTARSNFATTHANITGLNDSLMSAYLAGWLGAAAYTTYTSMAGILGNNSYLTTLGGNATLMTLLNANSASCTAIGANMSTGITNGNNTWLNACGGKANIMTAIDANSNARTLIVNNVAKAIAVTTFWTACCGKSSIMNDIAANATAMTTVAANATAMTTVAASSTAMTAVAASSTAMTAIGKTQNGLDKIWASAYLNTVMNNSTGMAALKAIQSTLNGFGYAVINAASDYSVWHGKKIFFSKNVAMNCTYSGAIKSATLPKGTYNFYVWGASGGGNGGQGGYSYGTCTLSSVTAVYLVAGGAGAAPTAGYNGGGAGAYSYYGGGGGSDIRLLGDTLYHRVIVAGGGGGSGPSGTSGYGDGGGVNGLSGRGNTTAQSGENRCGYGGTPTAGGAGNNTWSGGTSGAGFGVASKAGNWGAGGGGGGWYGGSGAWDSDSDSDGGYGGGGSGYVYTSSTASQYPSGCKLSSAYYLTSAATAAGNTSFTDYSGSTVTGHQGNGACRIIRTA